MISFSKFSDVLLAFTCASAFGVSIFSPSSYFALHLTSDSKKVKFLRKSVFFFS